MTGAATEQAECKVDGQAPGEVERSDRQAVDKQAAGNGESLLALRHAEFREDLALDIAHCFVSIKVEGHLRQAESEAVSTFAEGGEKAIAEDALSCR